jgi:Uma2 family endonuclease
MSAGAILNAVEAHGGRVAIASPATMHTGPLGSQVHVLHADAGTVTALAAIDWNRWFGRVCLDPVRGLVVLMTPSHLHEDLAEIFDDIVDAAASVSKRLGSTRLRGRNEPPGTGMEPDCAFYLDERARGYRAALVEGEAAVESFVERTPFDLVVEVEITNGDEGKIERYGDIGVRELWRLHGRKGTRDLRADFFALHPGRPPRRLAASAVLAGLTPGDVCEAADNVRLCLTRDERTEAVARIVRRRRRASVRVREAETPYATPPG